MDFQYRVIRFSQIGFCIALCVALLACGARKQRDLSIQGASELFDVRRAANRAAEARLLEGNEPPQTDADYSDIIPVLPPRRRVLQVRVPTGVSLEDVADGIISNSQRSSSSTLGTTAPSLAGTLDASDLATVHLNNEILRLENQIRNIDTDIETLGRTLRGQRAALLRVKTDLDFIVKQQAQAQTLLFQGFKLENERQLQEFLAQTQTAYNQAQPATILGLSRPDAENSAGADTPLNSTDTLPALFGNDRIAAVDDYIDLNRNFIFYGGPTGPSIVAGRLSDLAGNIKSRALNINLNNLRVASAIRSVARSISLPVYLSPALEASDMRVRLEISKATALDILGIIIDNHGLALVYDRRMNIARIYTAGEFETRLKSALATVEAHNRRAGRFKTVSNLERDKEAIVAVYRRYFQQPDAAGRHRSLVNDAILEDSYSSNVSAAIVAFKQRALENERALAALEQTQKTERAPLEAELEERNFAIEDINFDLNILLEEKRQKNLLLAEALQRRTAMTKKPEKKPETAVESADAEQPDTPEDTEDDLPLEARSNAPVVQPTPLLSRDNIIVDGNLATTEPIYTEMFTVYNNEGANSCEVGDAGARAAEIKSALDAYFLQIYPDNVIAVERAAERRIREEVTAREDATRDALERAASFDPDTETSDAPPDASPDASESAPLEEAPPPPRIAPTIERDVLENSDFRRPTTFSDNGNSIIITGFKRDLDLAASLIEELDRAKKQVLVEVFMVNVVKNWRRELQGRIENAFRDTTIADADVVGLTATPGAPNVTDLRDGGRLGLDGQLGFANRATASNQFKLSNFKLGLAWTIDFMEENSLGRQISSPTILAIDGCPATISKTTTRTLTRTIDGGSVISNGVIQNNPDTTEEITRPATLNLTVTPRVNPLNHHVRLDIGFVDSSFIGDGFDADQVSSNIATKFNAAPGDVIVLAGLFSESNAQSRNGLPGTTSVPLLSSALGTNSDQLSSDEMVIFLAPTVITPEIGVKPVNSAEYLNVR